MRAKNGSFAPVDRSWFEVVCRFTNGCVLVKDSPTEICSPDVTRWVVTHKTETTVNKNATGKSSLKLSGGGNDIFESESDSDVEVGTSQTDPADDCPVSLACQTINHNLKLLSDVASQNDVHGNMNSDTMLSDSESNNDPDSVVCKFSDMSTSSSDDDNSVKNRDEGLNRSLFSRSFPHSDVVNVNSSVPDNNEDRVDQIDPDDFGDFFREDVFLADLELSSVKHKSLRFKGTFSRTNGNNSAEIHVCFEDDPLPVKVDMKCDMHSSIISGKCCPCQCILRIDKAVRDNKFRWWPADSSCLYPAALRCESVEKALLTDQSVFPKDMLLDVPSFTSSQCSDPGRELMDAAQKYKNTFGGPRIQSNGELNSSA